MGKRLIQVLMASMLAFLLVPARPAGAVIPQPDSTIQILTHDVFRNLAEAGDWLFVAEYDIPYATPPSTSANDTYLLRVMDTTGTTTLGSNVPYPYNDGGYNTGVVSVYFSAAQFTALSMTWGAPYIVRLEGNFTQFAAPPPVVTYTLTAGDYDPSANQAASQAALSDQVIALAQILETNWAVALTTSDEFGIRLNTVGASYFTRAVFGLQRLAPNSFETQVLEPIATVFPTPTGTPFAQTLDETFSNTDAVGLGMTSLGSFLGVSKGLAAALVATILYIVTVALVWKFSGSNSMGLLIGFPWLFLGAYLGMNIAFLFALILLAAALLAFSLFMRNG